MLELRQVTVTRDQGARTAVRGVTMRMDRGEIVTVIGATGAGKSTLLRVIAGMVEPSHGEVWTQATTIGTVQQDPDGQVLGGTVAEDVAFGLESGNVPSAAMPGIVDAALTLVNMSWAAARVPATLSGGERQRLALAGAIAPALAADGPALLVLDEPTSQLDPASAMHVANAVRQLMTQHDVTVVWATQNPDEMDLSGRVVALELGVVAFDGAPADLVAHPGYVERLGIGMPDAARVVHELADRGVHLPGMPLSTSGLEMLLAGYSP